MNDIVAAAVEHELERRTRDLREQLEDVLAKLNSFDLTDEEFEKDAARFAEGEELDDPLQATYVDMEDTYGVGEIFANTLERRSR